MTSLREGCASVLQMDGHVITATGRGAEALELVRRKRFDLVLVDLYMTPVSGMEVLKAAVEAHKQVIVVVMTGNPTVASSIEALRAGAWDYLPKPFSASHLQVLVGRAAAAVRDVKAGGSRSGYRRRRQLMSLLVSTHVPEGRGAGAEGGATDASVMISGRVAPAKMIAQFILAQPPFGAQAGASELRRIARPSSVGNVRVPEGAFTGPTRQKLVFSR